MMRQSIFLRASLLAILAALFWHAPDAQAQQMQTFERVVRRGQVQKIYQITHIDPTCRETALVQVNLLESPHAGQIRLSRQSVYPAYIPWNVRSRCNARKVPGTVVSYQGTGASAEDAFVLEAVDGSGVPHRYRFHVSIR